MVRIFSPVCELLLLTTVVAAAHANSLVRKRREWILPPKPLVENVDYTKSLFIAKIRSDFDVARNIHYGLEGIGASQYPFNVFVVDPKTGYIRVTKKLDREEIPTYNLLGIATFTDGSHAETKIEIRIKVVDENDNAPEFPEVIEPGEVWERSPADTKVMTVIATDRDEPGHINSQMVYSLLRQEPADDMFYLQRDGTIYVKKDTLDRETVDRYVLTVKAQDLNGAPAGKTGTGTVTINVRDVNDNLPTLEKTEYAGNIKENTYGVEVMRFKAVDSDLVNSENWQAVYVIAKGNEAGYFSIRTDPRTNEGVLMLVKPVDYEDVKNLDLGLIVKNKVPMFDGSVGFGNVHFGGEGGLASAGGGAGGAGGPGGAGGASGADGPGGPGGAGGANGASGATGASGGSSPTDPNDPNSPNSPNSPSGPSGPSGATGASGGGGGSSELDTYTMYPVKINVQNEPEGPRFDPKVKSIPVSEGEPINLNDVIARYPAIDEDTGKPAENVRYVKGIDPGNWLTIDPETAEIKLNKLPDRESPLLVNGTYYAEVLCITEDMPAKTATGTIAIQVEDSNDQCPRVMTPVQTMCLTEDHVLVNAHDGDEFPNGAPLHFAIVPENSQGKWQVQHLNDTAVIVRADEHTWPGVYELELIVTDQQGVPCPEPQRVRIRVCTCEDGVKCGKAGGNGEPERKVELGPGGIGLLLLGLLLLLLLPLLALFCHCGGMGGLPGDFAEMPFDTKSHLINYHTEGQGENTEVPLISMPAQVDGNMVNMNSSVNMSNMGFKTQTDVSREVMNEYYQGFGAGQVEGTWRGMSQMGGSGVYSEYMSRETEAGIFDGMALPLHYLGEYYSQKVLGAEAQAGKDSLLVYDYEGESSRAGSVGCCSSLGLDNDLSFLDDLDPKFKTLAEVCGAKVQAEVKAPPPSASISSHTAVSSVAAARPLPQLTPLPQPIPKPQPVLPPVVSSSVVQESSERSQTVTVKEVSREASRGPAPQAPQGQVLLVKQQPQLYYTTAPVMQPMHYMVQPPVQNTVLLAEAPGPNLQSVMLVNGPQTGPAQGLVVQGQTLVKGQTLVQGQAQGPGMVLVEKAQGPRASISGSQTMVVVDGKGPSVLKSGQNLVQPGLPGSQTVLVVGSGSAQGPQPVALSGAKSGSQSVLVVESHTAQGQEPRAQSSLSGALVGSLRALNKSTSTTVTRSSSTRNSAPSGSKKVVVKERKVIQQNL